MDWKSAKAGKLKKVIRLPYTVEEVGGAITVMVLRTGEVQLLGNIDHHEAAQGLLFRGIERLNSYHAERHAGVTLLDANGLPVFAGPHDEGKDRLSC
jgi:hypothetical protein